MINPLTKCSFALSLLVGALTLTGRARARSRRRRWRRLSRPRAKRSSAIEARAPFLAKSSRSPRARQRRSSTAKPTIFAAQAATRSSPPVQPPTSRSSPRPAKGRRREAPISLPLPSRIYDAISRSLSRPVLFDGGHGGDGRACPRPAWATRSFFFFWSLLILWSCPRRAPVAASPQEIDEP